MENDLTNYVGNVDLSPRDEIKDSLERVLVKKSIEFNISTTTCYKNFFSKSAKKKGYTYCTLVDELYSLVKNMMI